VNEDESAEVVLAVREISDIEIIATADDQSESQYDTAESEILRYAGASRIISPKTIMGTFLAQIIAPPKKDIFPGSIEFFHGLMLAELSIHPGSELIDQTLDSRSIINTGANIVGIWQKGVFVPSPVPGEKFQSNSMLLAVGTTKELSKMRELTLGNRRSGRLIIVGYGSVGRQVARVLFENGIEPVIVDQRDLGDLPFKHITGNATSSTALLQAGIKDAMGILVMLRRDLDAISTIILAKNLNPDLFVIVRINQNWSAERIYKAGADYVVSMPILTGHMLIKIIKGEKEELGLLYKDLELKLFPVEDDGTLIGKSLEEADFLEKFGCMVVAVERGGKAITGVTNELVLKRGDLLALIGNPESLEVFDRSTPKRSAVGFLMQKTKGYLREFDLRAQPK
jgi:Trk K+ transport system NAD-binding subunit